ncbi:NUDIX hydrolase [Streptomyces tendae]
MASPVPSPDPSQRVRACRMLPGGTVETTEATPEDTLHCEAAEEAQLTLTDPVRLGWVLDKPGEVHGGMGPNARLRLAARVTAIGPTAVDPATGRPFARLLATPAQTAALLGWGPPGARQARLAADTAHKRWGLPAARAAAIEWNGDPRELHLTEGVMLAWFTPDNLHRLRIAETTSDLVRRHAASLSTAQSRPGPVEGRPASPHGTVPNIIGVHLYLERPDGTVLLGLRHPDSAFAPSTWHVLAGHCEQENAIACLIREAREEAGLHIERQDVELVHVVHHIDKAGDRPRMGLFFRARTWSGEPVLSEPDKCTQWKFWDPAALPENLVPYTRLAIAKIQNGELYSETGWPA